MKFPGFCSDQFPELNKLIGHYGPAKFNVLAFPCNQFGGNEPGKNSEILNGLKFVRPGKNFQPHAKGLKIFGKIDVNGKNQHNLYKFLTVIVYYSQLLLYRTPGYTGIRTHTGLEILVP